MGKTKAEGVMRSKMAFDSLGANQPETALKSRLIGNITQICGKNYIKLCS
jgi:hypothetical protein